MKMYSGCVRGGKKEKCGMLMINTCNQESSSNVLRCMVWRVGMGYSHTGT